MFGYISINLSKSLAPMLKRVFIFGGGSGPPSPNEQGQEDSLDGKRFGGPDVSPVINEEFLMNAIGEGFGNSCLIEFAEFLGRFPLVGRRNESEEGRNRVTIEDEGGGEKRELRGGING